MAVMGRINRKIASRWATAVVLATVVWACSSPPPLPVAVDDAYVGDFDAQLTVAAPGVLANDTASGGAADAGARATTAGGSATLAADGSFTYQPASGHFGADTFTYTVTNTTGTSSAATVTIEVPAPPTAVDDAYAAPYDALFTVPAPGLLGNDTPRGGSVDAAVLGTTGGGTATLLPNGGFTFLPAAGYGGVDTFTYTVTNAYGTSTPATVSIEVPAAPWVTLPPLPTVVSRTAGAVVDGVMYAFGGESTGGLREGRLFAFDRSVGSWAEASAMPTAGSNVCAAAVGTRIFSPGGYTGTAGIPDLQVFDTTQNTWSVVDTDPLPTAIYAHACAVHDGKVYVFGGDPTGIAGTTAWSYDPDAAPGTRWNASLAPLPAALHYAAAVTVGDQIFVAGGLSGADLATVYAYAPATDTWTPYPDLTTARAGAGAWVSGPYLFVGGGGFNSFLTSVERYDTRLGAAGSWTTVADLGVGRRTFAYASDPGAGWFYAVAGWAGAYLDVAEEGLLAAPLP
jgi:N-acetylneuraminic acid mutarotase